MLRNLSYDQSSGQVFTEVTVAAKSKESLWWNNRKGKLQNPSTFRRRHLLGTSSLYDAALRVCTFNAEWITPEALICANWPYAERIYKYLKTRDALTFRIWKTFQEAFPDVAELDHIYQVRVPGTMGTPPTEIPSITRQLTTLPFSTLTNLNVRNLLLRHVHLMDLTNFSNLAVLALEQFVECAAFPFHYDTGIDEQFMKRWGVIVQEKKAFMQLKVIVFRAFRISIPVTLNCFEKFSSLALCNTDYLVMEGLTNSFVPKTWRLMDRIKNPQRIWENRQKTAHQRMAELDKFANSSAPSDGAQSSETAVVSIHYGHTDHHCADSNDSWFARQAPSPEDPVEPEKRPNDDGSHLSSKVASVNKKRKIRASKQTNITSLLGSLGHT